MSIETTIKVIKWLTAPIGRAFANLFRKPTGIFGPSKSGKTTFLKILQDKPYRIGEYNHTSAIMVCDKKNVTFKSTDKNIDPVKIKIKHDVPGEDFDAWKELILQDKPQSIILIVDLVGLVKNGALSVNSEEKFVNLDCKDTLGNHIIQETTPKEKFEEQVNCFKTIWETYKKKKMKLIGMTVFLNKCDIWLIKGVDELDIKYQFKKELQKYVDLNIMSNDLTMKHDICFEVTSMLPELKRKYLEPSIIRHGSMTN